MATYVYETIPASTTERPERFEIQQSMKDEPLRTHPITGQPIRRVISGGYGFTVAGSGVPAAAPSPHSCGGSSCGCHHS